MEEGVIRLGIFAGAFLVFAFLEIFIPRRSESQERPRRWSTNLLLSIINTLMLRFALPFAAVSTAYWAQVEGFGLANWLAINPVIAGVIAFFALDFAVWAMHVASHKVPFLWHLHKVHHTDPRFDVTTALRFHPLEIAVSMLWKVIVVALLGAPVLSVVVFEVVLNAAAMFNHANIKLSDKADRILRWMIVTPDMHRIHHSTRPIETDSNYGFNLPWWDRLFSTYVNDPKGGQENITFGLSEFQGKEPRQLGWSLLLPFKALAHVQGWLSSRVNKDGTPKQG